jgi:hypothetical protein
MANGAYERLYFEEMDGKRRRVVLQGTEAPKGHTRGATAFDLGGEVRRKLKPEPGSDEPVVHVMGLQHRDLVVRVHFRDSMTGLNGNAEKRVKLIEEIKAAARPLRIVWGKTLRIGLLHDTQHGVEGEGEYESVLTFDVYSTGDAKARRRSSARPLALAASLEGVLDELAVAKGHFKVPGFSTNFGSVLEELFSAIVAPLAGLLSLANDIAGAVDEVAYALQSVQRKLFQIANSAKRLQTKLKDAWSFVSSSANPGEDAESRLAWGRARAEGMESLRKAIQACGEVGESAERRAIGTGKTRFYTTHDGDTAEGIARMFATSVATIRSLNPSLPMGALAGGTRILVPGGKS